MALKIALALVAVQLAIVGVATAGAVDDSLAIGKEFYHEGEYGQALAIFSEIHGKPELTRAQRIDCLKHLALTLYLTSKADEAKAYWLQLLAIDPDHEFDRDWDSPVLIEYFEKIEPPEKPATDDPSPEPETPNGGDETPPDDTVVRGCGIVLCLIPFGVGQFANDSYIKGTIIAVFEIGLFAAALAILIERQITYDSNPYGLDAAADSDKAIAQNVIFFSGVGVVIFGVVDAFLFP